MGHGIWHLSSPWTTVPLEITKCPRQKGITTDTDHAYLRSNFRMKSLFHAPSSSVKPEYSELAARSIALQPRRLDACGTVLDSHQHCLALDTRGPHESIA